MPEPVDNMPSPEEAKNDSSSKTSLHKKVGGSGGPIRRADKETPRYEEKTSATPDPEPAPAPPPPTTPAEAFPETTRKLEEVGEKLIGAAAAVAASEVVDAAQETLKRRKNPERPEFVEGETWSDLASRLNHYVLTGRSASDPEVEKDILLRNKLVSEARRLGYITNAFDLAGASIGSINIKNMTEPSYLASSGLSRDEIVELAWSDVFDRIASLNPNEQEDAAAGRMGSGEQSVRQKFEGMHEMYLRTLVHAAEKSLMDAEVAAGIRRVDDPALQEANRKVAILGFGTVPGTIRALASEMAAVEKKSAYPRPFSTSSRAEGPVHPAMEGLPMFDSTVNDERTLRFNASSYGIFAPDFDKLKSGTQREIEAWLRQQIDSLESAVDTESVKKKIGAGLSIITALRRDEPKEGNGKLFHEAMFEIWKDKFLFSQLFTAFDAAGKDDYGKAASDLWKMSREVFGGKEGSERLTRLWKEAFPVMGALESNRERLVTYLDATSTSQEEAILSEIATETKLNMSQTLFGRKFWRLIGRQALFDAFLPQKPKPGEEINTWSGLRKLEGSDKALGKLMSLGLWAKKNQVGANAHMWTRVDTGYRDFVSFMLEKDNLQKYGLERDERLIVSDISKLGTLDFTLLDKNSSMFPDWVLAADRAGSTSEALTDWMRDPKPETFVKVKGKYLHYFSSPSRTEFPPAYEQPIIGKFRDGSPIKLDQRQVRILELARLSLRLITDLQENPKLIVRSWKDQRDYVESLLITPSSSGKDREVEMAMAEALVPLNKGRVGEYIRMSGHLVSAVVKGLLGIKG